MQKIPIEGGNYRDTCHKNNHLKSQKDDVIINKMKENNSAFLPTMSGKIRKDQKMKVFYHDLKHSVKSDGFSLRLLNDTMPDWLYKGLRKDMANSLRGFTDEVALEIADNLIDCWSGLGLHLTGIGHVDAMLWDFYWRILDCAHTKGIKIEYK